MRNLWCRFGVHSWIEYAFDKALHRICFDCSKVQEFTSTKGWVDYTPPTPDYLKDCDGGDEHDHGR
jgi:hypothetical protein